MRPKLPKSLELGTLIAAFTVSGIGYGMLSVAGTRYAPVVFGQFSSPLLTLVSIVLVSIGVGALVAGRLVDSTRYYLRFYVGLELVIAALALLAFHGIRLLDQHVVTSGLGAASYHSGLLVVAVTYALALVLPSALIGATFPILGRYSLRSGRLLVRRLGLLVGGKLLGVLIGRLGAEVYSTRTLGITQTVSIAAGLVAVAGLVGALIVLRKRKRVKIFIADLPEHWSVVAAASEARILVVMGVLGLFGLLYGAYATAGIWVLSRITECSTYSHVLMLGPFLAGLSLGALAVGFINPQQRNSSRNVLFLAVGLMVVGIAGVVAATFIARGLENPVIKESSAAGWVSTPSALAAFLLFFLSVILGMVLITALSVLTFHPISLGRSIGRGVFIVLLGGVIGVLAGSYAAPLIPMAEGSYDRDSEPRIAKFLGHLGMILHPDPQQILILESGTGQTVRSCLLYKPESITVVESAKRLGSGARFSAAESEALSTDSLVKGQITEPVTYVRYCGELYDLILSSRQGHNNRNANLQLSQDFYEMCKEHLQPGGLFCQRVDLADYSADALKIVVAGFISAFPEGQLWVIDFSAILVGGVKKPLLYLDRITDLLTDQTIDQDLNEIRMNQAYPITAAYLLGSESLTQLAQGQRPERLAHPRLEYLCPDLLSAEAQAINLSLLFEARKPIDLRYSPGGLDLGSLSLNFKELYNYVMAADQIKQGTIASVGGKPEAALAHYQKALEIWPAHREARYQLAYLYRRLAETTADPVTATSYFEQSRSMYAE